MNSFAKSKLFERYPDLKVCEKELSLALSALANSFKSHGKLLVMGNGGSSADAEHFCGELVKGFVLKRPLSKKEQDCLGQVDPSLASQLQSGFPAFSLGVSHSLISAFSNDLHWDNAFAQQVHVFAQPNDVVFAISTSGNSKNVVQGLKVAKAKGIKTISLTGEKSSLCSELSDITIRVPRAYTHEIQELHLPVYHALAMELEYLFFNS